MLRHWTRYGCGQWSVVERHTDQVIGCIGFYSSDGQSDIELGWAVLAMRDRGESLKRLASGSSSKALSR
jgi:hypothetical protein